MDAATYIDRMLAADDHPAAPSPNGAGGRVAFTIKKFVLAALLDKAGTVVPTRDVMPVLKCFQVHAGPDRLRVVATDMELSMVATTPLVTVTHQGTVVFPAKRLLDIVREADDGDAHVTVTGVATPTVTAAITIARTTWQLKLPGGDDYPAMPEVTEVTFTTVDRAAFTTALAAVRYAACRDANRASMMMIDIKGGRMTACDGVRFQQAPTAELPFTCQIPIGAVDHLLKLLRGSDLPDIAIGESGHRLVFRLGTDTFIVNKLMAAFPDTDALFLRPALENRHELTVDRAELLRAIKRVRINADTTTSAIALHLAAGTCTVAARDTVGNTATETIDAGWTRPPRTIVVNHTFLTDMVNAQTDPTLTLTLGEDTKTRRAPVMLRGSTDPGCVGVVQQMLGDWLGT